MATVSQRFVVFATPRSGSNWLCTLLDSHPDILCHHELFNPEGIHIAWSLRGSGFDLGGLKLQREAPLELLRRTWLQSRGYDCVGFKVNLGQSELVFSTVLDDPTIRKILVSRRNRIRAYVSESIAEISGQWESFPDSTPPSPVQPVRIELESLKAHIRRNQTYLEDIRQRLSRTGQDLMETHYETIGDAACHRELLNYLGVDQSVELVGRTSRMNPQPLASLIENYQELTERLAETDLANDFVDEEVRDGP